MENVTWAMDLVDKMSGPMDVIDKALKGTGKSMMEVDKALAKLDKQMKVDAITKTKDPLQKQAMALKLVRDEATKAGDGSKGFFDSFAKAGAVAGFTQTLADKVFGLTSKVTDLGKAFVENAIGQSEARKETVRSLDAVLGGADKAKDAYAKLENISKTGKRARSDVFESFRALVEQGASSKNAQDIVEAGNDLEARLSGSGKAFEDSMKAIFASQSTTRGGVFDASSFDKIKSMGLGPGAQDKFVELIATKHKTDVRGAKALIMGGLIKGQEGAEDLFKIVQDATSGKGKVGGLAKDIASGSVGVQVKNLRDNFDRLFESGDASPLAHSIKGFAEMLDPTSEKGKKLQTAVEKAFNAFAKGVDRIAASDFEGTMDKIIVGVDAVGDAMGEVNAIFKAAGDVGDVVLGAWNFGIKQVADPIFALGDAIDSISAKWTAFSKSAGGGITDGLAGGLKGGAKTVDKAIQGLGKGIIGGVRDVLDIHSPSRKMEKLGGFTAKGFALGIEKSPMPELDAFKPMFAPTPKLDAFNPEIPRLNVALPQIAANTNRTTNTNSSRASITIGDIYVTPQGGLTGNAAADGKAMGEAVRAEIVRFLEGAAIESGGMGVGT